MNVTISIESSTTAVALIHLLEVVQENKGITDDYLDALHLVIEPLVPAYFVGDRSELSAEENDATPTRAWVLKEHRGGYDHCSPDKVDEIAALLRRTADDIKFIRGRQA